MALGKTGLAAAWEGQERSSGGWHGSSVTAHMCHQTRPLHPGSSTPAGLFAITEVPDGELSPEFGDTLGFTRFSSVFILNNLFPFGFSSFLKLTQTEEMLF